MARRTLSGGVFSHSDAVAGCDPVYGKGAGRANAGKMGTGWIDRTSGEDERKSRDRPAHRATAAIDEPVANRY